MAKPGLALIFGKDKGKDTPDEDIADGGADDAEEGDVSEEARTAWEEYDAAPSAEGFCRAVKACMGGSY